MEIIEFIKQLLYRYDCVILPEFGAFLAQRTPAKLSASHKVFYPPQKKLSFNQQIVSNDGLLANYISKKKQISYEQANLVIQEFVAEVKNDLQKNGRYTFEEIGIFTQQSNQKLIFEPLHTNNYLKEAFGLSTLRVNGIFRDTSENDTKVIDLNAEASEPKGKSFYYLRRFIAASVILGGVYALYRINPYAKYIDYQNAITLEQSKKEIKQDIQSASFSLDIYDTLAPIRLSALLSSEDRELIDEITKRKAGSADVELTHFKPFDNVNFDEGLTEEEEAVALHRDSIISRASKLIGHVEGQELQTEGFENFGSEIDLEIDDTAMSRPMYTRTIATRNTSSSRTTTPSRTTTRTSTTSTSAVSTRSASTRATKVTPTHKVAKPTKAKAVSKKYHVIAGVYSSYSNARNAMKDLEGKGFSPNYVGKSRTGKHKVAYATVYSQSEANKLLRHVQKQFNKDAWILTSK